MVTTQRKPKQLGQILLEQGLISEEHLQRALEEHRNTPKSLGRVLIDLGYIRERDLVRALAEQVGLEFVDLTEYRVDAAATALLPEALCRRYRALPIGEEDGKLLVAMSDPANVYALDDIRTITGRDVRPVVATSNDVEQAIAEVLGDGRSGRGPRVGGRRGPRHRIRPHAGRGGGRGRPDRQARPGDHDASRGRPSVGRAHRADREGRARPVPRRRRAPRGHALAEEHPGRAHQPSEGHGRPQHRREARPAGRARVAAGQQPERWTCGWRRCPPSTARRS